MKMIVGAYLNVSLALDTRLTVLLPRLNRAAGLLAKIRNFTPKFLNYILLFVILI